MRTGFQNMWEVVNGDTGNQIMTYFSPFISLIDLLTPRYRDSLWYFKPSEMTGYFTLHNAGFSWGTLAVMAVPDTPEKAAPMDNYLFIGSGRDLTIPNGGTRRDNGLWKVYPGARRNQFLLKNRGFKEYASTTPRYGEFYKYMRVVRPNGNSSDYAVGGAKRGDAYLKFKLISVSYVYWGAS